VKYPSATRQPQAGAANILKTIILRTRKIPKQRLKLQEVIENQTNKKNRNSQTGLENMKNRTTRQTKTTQKQNSKKSTRRTKINSTEKTPNPAATKKSKY